MAAPMYFRSGGGPLLLLTATADTALLNAEEVETIDLSAPSETHVATGFAVAASDTEITATSDTGESAATSASAANSDPSDDTASVDLAAGSDSSLPSLPVSSLPVSGVVAVPPPVADFDSWTPSPKWPNLRQTISSHPKNSGA